MVFQAYCDDAGSPYVCVAGYVFEPEQCLRLDDEWSQVIHKYGVSVFHMGDCAHGTGEFQGMPKKDRAELATACIGIIKRRARMGIIASVDQAEFRRLGTPRGYHDAYVQCLVWCVAGAGSWARRYASGQKISFFFESGATLQKRADRAIEFSRQFHDADPCNHSHTFIGKKDAKALQAADLLAWEWQAELRNFIGPPKRLRRRSLVSLLQSPHIYCHLTFDHIAAMLSGNTSQELLRFHAIEANARELNVVSVRQ
jgi:hypothetical protein